MTVWEVLHIQESEYPSLLKVTLMHLPMKSPVISIFPIIIALVCCSDRCALGVVIIPGGNQPIFYTTITYTGAPAPQRPGNVISSVDEPQTDDQGVVAMYGQYNPTNVGNYTEAIWLGPIGNQQLIAQVGTAAPGTPSGVVFGSGNPGIGAMGYLSDAPSGGVIAFGSRLTGTGVTSSNNLGIWSGTAGHIQLVARSGSAAPGTTGAFVSLDQFMSVNSAGAVAFQSTIAGAGITQFSNDLGLWEGNPGSLQLVARTGTQAPGVAAGTTFSYLGGNGFTELDLNDSGTVAFTAGLSGRKSMDTRIPEYGSESPVHWNSLPRPMAPAPGTNGAHFGSLHSNQNSNLEPVLDANGNLAFRAVLLGGDTTSTNNVGIFAWTNNALKLVVRAGTPAPGVPNAAFAPTGTGFGAFAQPALAGGRLAFEAGIVGTGLTQSNDSGIWAGTFSSLHLVAQSVLRPLARPLALYLNGPAKPTTFSIPRLIHSAKSCSRHTSAARA